MQHDFARQILARLLEVERKKLDTIPVSQRAVDDRPHLTIKSELSLSALIPAALVERSPAMEYLDIVLASLEEQTE
jgi:hypothetical protein